VSARMPPERRRPRPLAIDSSHHLFRITGTRRDALRRKLIWSRKVLRRERHVERRCILLEIFAALRAGDRHDIVALRQHPGERKLRGCATLLLCQCLDAPDQLEVPCEVLALKAWQGAAPRGSKSRNLPSEALAEQRFEVTSLRAMVGMNLSELRAGRDQMAAQSP